MATSFDPRQLPARLILHGREAAAQEGEHALDQAAAEAGNG
jgi:hypothetical protein